MPRKQCPTAVVASTDAMRDAPEAAKKPGQAWRAGRAVDLKSRRVGKLLLHLVEGGPGVVRALAELLGTSEDAIKSKTCRARYDDSLPDFAVEGDGLDANERRYFAKLYKNSSDPAIREFLGQIHAPVRNRPDWRSSSDPAAG